MQMSFIIMGVSEAPQFWYRVVADWFKQFYSTMTITGFGIQGHCILFYFSIAPEFSGFGIRVMAD